MMAKLVELRANLYEAQISYGQALAVVRLTCPRKVLQSAEAYGDALLDYETETRSKGSVVLDTRSVGGLETTKPTKVQPATSRRPKRRCLTLRPSSPGVVHISTNCRARSITSGASRLNRAAKLFGKNTAELRNHLAKFVGQSTSVNELPEGFDSEAARLLLNYLAALAGLRDAQRVVHRRLWPDREDEARACETCGRSDPKRTRWETTLWDPKRQELLGDERIVFLTKERDCTMPPL
jgi:hypothetical protein